MSPFEIRPGIRRLFRLATRSDDSNRADADAEIHHQPLVDRTKPAKVDARAIKPRRQVACLGSIEITHAERGRDEQRRLDCRKGEAPDGTQVEISEAEITLTHRRPPGPREEEFLKDTVPRTWRRLGTSIGLVENDHRFA